MHINRCCEVIPMVCTGIVTFPRTNELSTIDQIIIFNKDDLFYVIYPCKRHDI